MNTVEHLAKVIAQDMHLEEKTINELHHLFTISDDDTKAIEKLQEIIKLSPDFWKNFYTRCLRNTALQKIIDSQFLKNNKRAIIDYFIKLPTQQIDYDYVINRFAIGIQLEKATVEPILFANILSNFYLQLIRYCEDIIHDTSLLAEIIQSYLKIVFLDLTLILHAYFFMKEKKLSDAKKELERLGRSYRLIHEINDLIVRTNDEHALYENVVKILVAVGNFDLAWIGMVDKQLNVIPVASYGATQYLNDIYISIDPSLPEGNGPTGTAIRDKTIIRINYPDEDPRFSPWKERAAQFDFKSTVAIPIIVDNNTNAIGAINLYSHNEHFITLGEAALLQEVANDISFAIDHIRKNKRLEKILFYDELTGLGNYNYFLSALTSQIQLASSQTMQLAVVTIDIDNFTAINNSFGFNTGDAILREHRNRLQNSIDASLIARDGDEFFILYPYMDEMELTSFISDLKMISAKPLNAISGELVISYCIGTATYPNDGKTAEELLNKSRIALTEAKKKGSGSICYYSEKLFQKSIAKISLEKELRNAFKNNEFILYYQPKIAIASRNISGLEALLRWNHPEKGLLMPSDFIAILESTDMIIQIGKWVAAEVSRQVQINPMFQEKSFIMSFNVSPNQFYDSSFIFDIIKTVKSSAINPCNLEIEVTENLLMSDAEDVIDTCNKLQQFGINISIDDFGTGYSSLSYLKKMPVSTLKIDASFVNGLPHNKDDVEIVKTVVLLAHSLGKKTIAEGVETREQLDFLIGCGVDEVQGYYFSKPMPIHECVDYCKNFNPGNYFFNVTNIR